MAQIGQYTHTAFFLFGSAHTRGLCVCARARVCVLAFLMAVAQMRVAGLVCVCVCVCVCLLDGGGADAELLGRVVERQVEVLLPHYIYI